MIRRTAPAANHADVLHDVPEGPTRVNRTGPRPYREETARRTGATVQSRTSREGSVAGNDYKSEPEAPLGCGSRAGARPLALAALFTLAGGGCSSSQPSDIPPPSTGRTDGSSG